MYVCREKCSYTIRGRVLQLEAIRSRVLQKKICRSHDQSIHNFDCILPMTHMHLINFGYFSSGGCFSKVLQLFASILSATIPFISLQRRGSKARVKRRTSHEPNLITL